MKGCIIKSLIFCKEYINVTVFVKKKIQIIRKHEHVLTSVFI